MNKLTFITKEQVEKCGFNLFNNGNSSRAAATDFATILGLYTAEYTYADSFYSKELDARTGYYWTKSIRDKKTAYMVELNGRVNYENVDSKCIGARPVLENIKESVLPNKNRTKVTRFGLKEIKLGYYPQQAASAKLQKELEDAYKSNIIVKTNNNYTTNSRKSDSSSKKLSPQRHQEYEYKGKRYIRIKSNFDKDTFTLSNGIEYQNGDDIWVEVKPIKWIFDEKEKIMITEKILFAGVPFNYLTNKELTNFNETDIKLFTDKYFTKDIMQIEKELKLKHNIEQLGIKNNTNNIKNSKNKDEEQER